MFREYFIEAQDFLRQQGFNPALRHAKAVSETDIDVIDLRTDVPMPAQLRRFYTEMGDAFTFVPNDVFDSPIEGWQPNWLSDYEIWNSGFFTAIEEEASREIARGRPRVDPQLLREEAESRKRWIPFYGFVGGGDVLCLDAKGKVRFYEALGIALLHRAANGPRSALHFQAFSIGHLHTLGTGSLDFNLGVASAAGSGR